MKNIHDFLFMPNYLLFLNKNSSLATEIISLKMNLLALLTNPPTKITAVIAKNKKTIYFVAWLKS